MVINVNDADDTHEVEGLPVDIVVAHHHMPLLANLLLYMYQRVPKHLRGLPKLEVKIQVVNQVRVSAITINKRLLLPLTYVGGYDSANVEICDPEIVKDFECHPPPRRSSICLQSIAAQLSLARVLDGAREWQGTYIAVKQALLYSDQMIDKVSTLENPESTTLVAVLKLKVEASVHDISLNIGTVFSTTLDHFLGYCQALDAARPTTRLLPLCQALEQYLRFAQRMYGTNQHSSLPRMLRNAVDHDPGNGLKLDVRAMLEMFDDFRANYMAFNDQLIRSLRFSELSATISRLYSVAGMQ